MRRINERPGCVVCICEKSGNISLFDPAAWRRAGAMAKKRAEEAMAMEDEREKPHPSALQAATFPSQGKAETERKYRRAQYVQAMKERNA